VKSSALLGGRTRATKIVLEVDRFLDLFREHLVVCSDYLQCIPAPVSLVEYVRRYTGPGETWLAELHQGVDLDDPRLCRLYALPKRAVPSDYYERRHGGVDRAPHSNPSRRARSRCRSAPESSWWPWVRR